eukprot:5886833-Prymnesium_polylepis.1
MSRSMLTPATCDDRDELDERDGVAGGIVPRSASLSRRKSDGWLGAAADAAASAGGMAPAMSSSSSPSASSSGRREAASRDGWS